MELSVCAFLKKNKLNKVVLSEERPRYTLLVPLLYNNGQHMMRDKKMYACKFSPYICTIWCIYYLRISCKHNKQWKWETRKVKTCLLSCYVTLSRKWYSFIGHDTVVLVFLRAFLLLLLHIHTAYKYMYVHKLFVHDFVECFFGATIV